MALGLGSIAIKSYQKCCGSSRSEDEVFYNRLYFSAMCIDFGLTIAVATIPIPGLNGLDRTLMTMGGLMLDVLLGVGLMKEQRDYDFPIIDSSPDATTYQSVGAGYS